MFGSVVHEFFLADPPGATYRPESAPFVVTEIGRAVCTYTGGEEIFTVIIVSESRQVSFQRFA